MTTVAVAVHIPTSWATRCFVRSSARVLVIATVALAVCGCSFGPGVLRRVPGPLPGGTERVDPPAASEAQGIYWTSFYGVLRRSNPDGTGITNVVVGVGDP